jgi:hypothetical protein
MLIFFNLNFILLSGTVSPVFAQRILSKVTVILEQLPEEKQLELTEFYKVIEEYINSYLWIEDNQGGEIRISMQFLLTYVPVSGESRYRANILVSNDKDVQYFDKRCRFAYETGEALYHNASEINSLTTLIDYFVYVIIGHEFDKFSRFGGESYFKLARERADQGRYGLGHFIDGWDLRQTQINEFVSEEFKPFRVMKDVFFYGLFLYDDKGEKGKGLSYMHEALKMIERELPQTQFKDTYTQFLNAYFSTIVQFFKDAPMAHEVFSLLIKIDPDHTASYEPFLK